MKQLHLTTLLLLLLAGCGKDKNEDPIDTNQPISFGGITVTDVNGYAISEDASDWNINDSWSAKEQSLFMQTYDTSCTVTHTYSVLVFPNPFEGQFMLHLEKPSSAQFAMRIVDRNYNLIFKYDNVPSNQMMFLSDSVIRTTDTVRMYYKFINGGCEYRGHGDLLHQ